MRNRKRAGRPCLKRNIDFKPKANLFKPNGVPASQLQRVRLKTEELEALRLKNLEELDQRECAKKMNTSAATFQRILSSAYYKISLALIEGKALEIEK